MSSPLNPFTLLRPAGWDEACAAVAEGGRPLAGGTDLLANLRRGLDKPAQLVDLNRLPGWDAIEDDGGTLVVGAGVTLARLANDERVARHLGALSAAARAVAGPGHRSAGTLGGNLCQDTRCVYYNQSEWWRQSNGWCLKRQGSVCHVAPQGHRCHAAFEGDVAPALLAAGAEVELATPSGPRRMPLQQMYRDDGAAHLALERGELVARIRVPAGAPGRRSTYCKGRARGAMDFPLAGVGVVLALRDGLLAELGVGLSGTNSHPVKLEGTEAFLGRPVDDATAGGLSKLVAKQVSPMRSTVTASNYRRQLAAVLVARAVRQLAAAA